MRLNSIKPSNGSKKAPKRVGRGEGSGIGKTCARGQKGQHARSGGYHKVGFEGGQMPLQRRLPKVGFHSRMARSRAEVRLHELALVNADEVTLETLKKAGLVSQFAEKAKIFVSGSLEKKVNVRGVAVTKGAREAIEKAGGSVA